MAANDQAETVMLDSSEDEIEVDDYERDLYVVADEPISDPLELMIERGLEKLVASPTFSSRLV
jgi:hypothetical protein